MKLKLRSRIKFFASLFEGKGTAVRKDGLASYVDLNFLNLEEKTEYVASNQLVAIQRESDGAVFKMRLSLLNGTQQIKADPGNVVVARHDEAIIVNKITGSATGVAFPLASEKVGDCLVADFKRDAGTNNITITPTSPETIQGLASYTIAADGASVRLKPVPGIGYVL